MFAALTDLVRESRPFLAEEFEANNVTKWRK
jgi:hypothetical protein